MARAAKRKVFCIGFQKTGTTTMEDALKILGYRVTGSSGTKDPDIVKNMDSMVRKLSFKYDAFQDNPWPIVYRQMDELHPGSRFILTVRDEDKWYSSMVRHFGSHGSPMREFLYGAGAGGPIGNEALYKDRLRRHNREVEEYFKDRPQDLLVMDLTRDGSWETICPFLAEPVPPQPFPHSNSATQRLRRNKLRKNWGILGRIAGRLVNAR